MFLTSLFLRFALTFYHIWELAVGQSLSFTLMFYCRFLLGKLQKNICCHIIHILQLWWMHWHNKGMWRKKEKQDFISFISLCLYVFCEFILILKPLQQKHLLCKLSNFHVPWLWSVHIYTFLSNHVIKMWCKDWSLFWAQ